MAVERSEHPGTSSASPRFSLVDSLRGLAALSVVVFHVTWRGVIRRALGTAPLLGLGTLSYGIYLWHGPLMRGFKHFFFRHGEPFALVAVVGVSICVALVSYVLVERPAQRWARRLTAPRKHVISGLELVASDTARA